MTPLRTAIIASIGPMGARTASEIAAELGEPVNIVQRALGRLLAAGKIKRTATGFYRHNHTTETKQ